MEVLNAVEPINEYLRDLHGPTDSIAHTMSQLVPFPELIDSLPDADLLDLSISVSEVSRSRQSGATVRASARYATSARISQAESFYLEQFSRAGVTGVQRNESCAGARIVIEAVLPWSPVDQSMGTTHAVFRVMLDQERGYRSVKISVSYGNFAHGELFDRFAQWHNGDAPVSSACEATGIEISTFASGREPRTLVLYSTHYRCDVTPHSTRRAMVDDRIRELGWGYREPRQGIMFMRDGAFDAETHVSGDEQGSIVTFVGEFQLR